MLYTLLTPHQKEPWSTSGRQVRQRPFFTFPQELTETKGQWVRSRRPLWSHCPLGSCLHQTPSTKRAFKLDCAQGIYVTTYNMLLMTGKKFHKAQWKPSIWIWWLQSHCLRSRHVSVLPSIECRFNFILPLESMRKRQGTAMFMLCPEHTSWRIKPSVARGVVAAV